MADPYTGKLLQHARHGPIALHCDVLVRIMALAWPREAALLAQSCKELHRAHQSFKARLLLEELHQLSSFHQLHVFDDGTDNIAYGFLRIPETLITLASPDLTAANIHAMVLAFRPGMGQLRQYVHKMFRDRTNTNLTVSIQVPGSFEVVYRLFALAPILHALANVVTHDFKLAISLHAQKLPRTKSLSVSYKVDICLDQPFYGLYEGIKQHLGQHVRDDLVEKEYDQCPESGLWTSNLCWVDTGLPALFRHPPSLSKRDQHPGPATTDGKESDLSQCKEYHPSHITRLKILLLSFTSCACAPQ